MPQALPWLEINSSEVFNNARTYHRMTNRLGNRIRVTKLNAPCEALDIDIHDAGNLARVPDSNGFVGTLYDEPIPYDDNIPYNGGWASLDFDDDPPWYDSDYRASGEFIGFWVESFEIPSNHARTAYPLSSTAGGSRFGRNRRTQREMPIEVLLISETAAGMWWGFEWLEGQLADTSGCGTKSATVRLYCTTATFPLDGLRTLSGIALLDPIEDNGSPLKDDSCLIRSVTLTVVAGDPGMGSYGYDAGTRPDTGTVTVSYGADNLAPLGAAVGPQGDEPDGYPPGVPSVLEISPPGEGSGEGSGS